MSIVYEDPVINLAITHCFKTSRNLGSIDHFRDRLTKIQTNRIGRSDRGNGVRDIKSTDQRDPDEEAAFTKRELKLGSIEIAANIRSLEIGICGAPVGINLEMLKLHLLEPIAVRVVYVNDRNSLFFGIAFHSGKQGGFRLKIALHPTVEIEVILGQVREHTDVEGNTRNSLLSNPMRRYLHGDTSAIRVHHFTEQPLHIRRLRSRMRRILHFITDDVVNRTNKASTMQHRLEQVMNQIGCGCLTVSPGHTNHGNLPTRVVLQIGRRNPHRQSWVRNVDPRSLKLTRIRFTGNNCDCPVLDRGINVFITVCAFSYESAKHPTLYDLARVVKNPRHFYVQRPGN